MKGPRLPKWDVDLDGILTGACIILVFVLVSAVWPEEGIFNSDLLSALVGAAVGGGISALVTQYSLDKSHQPQSEVELQRQKNEDRLVAFSLFVGFEDMLARLIALKDHMDGALANGPQGAEPWQLVQGAVTLHVPSRFYDIDRLRPLFEAREYDLLSKLVVMQRNGSVTLLAMEKYGELREKVNERLSPHEMEGMEVRTEVQGEEARWLQARLLK